MPTTMVSIYYLSVAGSKCGRIRKKCLMRYLYISSLLLGRGKEPREFGMDAWTAPMSLGGWMKGTNEKLHAAYLGHHKPNDHWLFIMFAILC